MHYERVMGVPHIEDSHYCLVVTVKLNLFAPPLVATPKPSTLILMVILILLCNWNLPLTSHICPFQLQPMLSPPCPTPHLTCCNSICVYYYHTTGLMSAT